jgi:putative ABC transport system ATP-binding protein
MTSPVISLRGIVKNYDIGEMVLPVLRGIDLDVESGEFVAVMGSSGSGKSTLMNIIGCLDRPSLGHYLLGGRDVSSLGRAELATTRNQMLGFVFQNFNLLARTSALENVALPLVYAGVRGKERQARARAALERVGLAERLEHNPSQLSGGQQQRVAIARALVGAPRIILADEPTGNLDSQTSLEVMALFQELGRSGITLILVTHEPDIALYASRVIVLKDGRVAADRQQTPLSAAEQAAAERAAAERAGPEQAGSGA